MFRVVRFRASGFFKLSFFGFDTVKRWGSSEALSRGLWSNG